MQVVFAEGAVTRSRREFKRVLSPEDAAAQCLRLETELGAPPGSTQITSIYFDRPGLPLAARAQRTPQNCLKVRTKEYAPDVGDPSGNRVVFEVKRERDGLTQKRRAWVRRDELGPRLSSEGASLLPVVAVTYRRVIYQRDDAWRITVDRDIRYHAVNAALAFGMQKLSPERLDGLLGKEDRVVLEVKHLGAELPSWLEALRGCRWERFSKFAEGVAHLGGKGSGGVREA